MKLHSRLLFLLTVTSTATLTGCGGGSKYSYQNITISVTPHITSIAVGATMTFTATVTNAPDTPDWSLSSFAYANVGSPTTQQNGTTFVYTAPPTPPIYTGTGAFGNTQGTVTLEAMFPDLGMNISDTQTFVVTAPSVTVGLSPATASVALNASQQFTGYTVTVTIISQADPTKTASSIITLQ
jgi:hypothetical protein